MSPKEQARKRASRRTGGAKPAAAPRRTARAAQSAGATTARSGSRTLERAPRASGPVGFVEPMKAMLVDGPPPGEWIYEIKFDGFRALALRDPEGTQLLSRNNRNLAGKFPSVAEAVAALPVSDVILDGEIVALDEQGRSSFQLLQAYDLGQERPPIRFFVFDLLRRDGRDLRPLPLADRRAELERLLGASAGIIRYSAALGSDAGPLLEQARALSLEGLIGKRVDSPYESGRRSGAWIKLKLQREQEFVIGGYTPPSGTRMHFGSVLVGFHEAGELRFAGKVGTGFNEALLSGLHARFQRLSTGRCPFVDLPEKRPGRYGQGVTAAEMRRCHWVRPELVCQVKFSEWTRDVRLRQPVFLGLREDKSAKEVVREHA